MKLSSRKGQFANWCVSPTKQKCEEGRKQKSFFSVFQNKKPMFRRRGCFYHDLITILNEYKKTARDEARRNAPQTGVCENISQKTHTRRLRSERAGKKKKNPDNWWESKGSFFLRTSACACAHLTSNFSLSKECRAEKNGADTFRVI